MMIVMHRQHWLAAQGRSRTHTRVQRVVSPPPPRGAVLEARRSVVPAHHRVHIWNQHDGDAALILVTLRECPYRTTHAGCLSLGRRCRHCTRGFGCSLALSAQRAWIHSLVSPVKTIVRGGEARGDFASPRLPSAAV
eukprot:scaffold952_cov409-Prasinococcus_capsulatus_cf.AAC.57